MGQITTSVQPSIVQQAAVDRSLTGDDIVIYQPNHTMRIQSPDGTLPTQSTDIAALKQRYHPLIPTSLTLNAATTNNIDGNPNKDIETAIKPNPKPEHSDYQPPSTATGQQQQRGNHPNNEHPNRRPSFRQLRRQKSSRRRNQSKMCDS